MTLSSEKQKLIDAGFTNSEFYEIYPERALRAQFSDMHAARAHQAQVEAQRAVLLDAAKSDPELALAAAHAALDAKIKRISSLDHRFLRDVFPFITETQAVDANESAISEKKNGLGRLRALFKKAEPAPLPALTPVQELMVKIGKCSLPSDTIHWHVTLDLVRDVLPSIVKRTDFPAEDMMKEAVNTLKTSTPDNFLNVMKVVGAVLPVLPDNSKQAKNLAPKIMSYAFQHDSYEEHRMLSARENLARCAKNNQAVLNDVVAEIKTALHPFKSNESISCYNNNVYAAGQILAEMVDCGARIDPVTRQDLTIRLASAVVDRAATSAAFAKGTTWNTAYMSIAIGEPLYRLAETDDILRQALPPRKYTTDSKMNYSDNLTNIIKNGYQAQNAIVVNKPQPL